MTEDLEIDYNEDEQATHVPDEELLWTHQVLNDFEQSIDSLGIETIMFLMSSEHEKILSAWIKNKVDIQNRRRQ
tara:strand:- start:147 stop:368 length:222 start_codon:yes stop_codon:yes gene_type:complete